MIKLYLLDPSNEAVCVWNAEDIYQLQKQHRIVGALIGVNPCQPNQVKIRHVPLRLSTEETKLLLEKGIAQLFCSPKKAPDEQVVKNFLKIRDQLCNKQIALNKERRKQEILLKCKDPKKALEKSEQVQEIPKEDTYFQIFTECPWKKDVPLEKYPIKPSTPEDKVKYAVFKDLWEKKFYITSGSKFGGDFLVYAGDPIICHSLYIVVCIPRSNKIQGLDIIVYGRLGNQVKKTVVLASVGENGKVEYISLHYVPESSKNT